MADQQFVERAVLQVNGVDLDDVINSVAEKSGRSSKYVNTMNKARKPKGIKQANNNWSLEMDAERIVDSRVPDWHSLKDSGATIKVKVRYNIGRPVSYTGKVTDISESTSDGDSTQKITVMCVDRKVG